MVVGSAVNVLHFAGDVGPPDSGAIHDTYLLLGAILPAGLVITVPNTGEVIEDTTGALVDVWTSTGGGTNAGSAPSSCAAGVGAVAGWTTGGIVNGRRLRGRTFAAPLTVNAYDTDGTITPSSLTVLQNWANALMASGPLAVWHRPTTPGGSDGNSYGVVSGRVRDKVAYLSSRRD